jgi:4-alpha-glucanotransferase
VQQGVAKRGVLDYISPMDKKIRFSGVLLHPTSLYEEDGIGSFGKSSYDFVDFLSSANVGLWQILPLGPVGFGNSPYASRSTFAGNELLISLDFLVDDNYLEFDDLKNRPTNRGDRINFEEVQNYKWPLLIKGANNFLLNATKKEKDSYNSFCEKESYWLTDYALFQSITNFYNDSRWFKSWPTKLANRDQKELEKWAKENKEEIDIYKVLQYFFYSQWHQLKEYANNKNIAIVGDIPIFVAHDSADAWTNRKILKLDEDGHLEASSGVPPDAFSETGQLWGNPLYDWPAMEKDNFSWWEERLAFQFEQTDFVRIDHFRGFEAYWEVPSNHKTAQNGKWVKVDGQKLFDHFREKFGSLAVIAEDLGVITKEVEHLRDSNNFPGMKIAQFAFNQKGDELDSSNAYLPHNYSERCVTYTGTHDNNTTRGWFDSLDPTLQDLVRRYLSCSSDSVSWHMMRSVMASAAQFAIIPIQDLLDLGEEGRMNLPGTCGDENWSWRLTANQINRDLAMRLKDLTQFFGRDSGYVELKKLF